MREPGRNVIGNSRVTHHVRMEFRGSYSTAKHAASTINAVADENARTGTAQWFLTTHWSVVLAAGTRDSGLAAAALETLCRAYWPPIYGFIRSLGHTPHDAEDLTQEFLARLLEENQIAAAEPERGRFRSFL